LNSISDVWQSVLSRLQEQLSETTIRTWFDEVDVVTMEDSAFVLHCSNSFKKSTIETRFMKHIKAALKDIFSSDLEVKILNDEQLAAYHGVAPDQPGSLLDSDAFTFETYVVGPQNKLAYAAARAVADKPAENFNPLFIYGDSGLGKTHLLYAIAHQVKRKREDLRMTGRTLFGAKPPRGQELEDHYFGAGRSTGRRASCWWTISSSSPARSRRRRSSFIPSTLCTNPGGRSC